MRQKDPLKTKVKLEEATDVLQNLGVDFEIINDFQQKIIEASSEEETEVDKDQPKPFKEYLVFDSYNDTDPTQSTVGWVVQIKDEELLVHAIDAIREVANNFNTSRKGRKNPVKTFAEAFESIPARYWKEKNITIKTKDSVYIHKIKNEELLVNYANMNFE